MHREIDLMYRQDKKKLDPSKYMAGSEVNNIRLRPTGKEKKESVM